MTNITQQNAALVEQAAAPSASPHEQGQQLTDVVAFFRLHDKTHSANRLAGPV